MDILIATNNKNKVKEYIEIFKDFDINCLSISDLNIDCDPQETGKTFHENSMIKAKEIAKFTDLPIISDDSGLVIDSLPDILGVYSHRFMPNNSYNEKCKEVIKLLENKPRNAHFVCVITLLNFNGETIQFEGISYGNISEEIKGENGFGYDPIFIPLGYDKTFSELDNELKNKLSHRGLASKKLIDFLNENLFCKNISIKQ